MAGKIIDGEMIADMVIPIHWAATERDGRHYFDRAFHTYTCRHHLPNGDCGIYERRPRMCADFPYDRPCPIDGCTFKQFHYRSNRSLMELAGEAKDTLDRITEGTVGS